MKKNLLLLLVISSPYLHFLSAQGQTIFQENFPTLIQQTCLVDPNQLVTYPEYWIVYQTADGTWDGPMDTNHCVSVSNNAPFTGIRIALDQVDPSRPLFLRALPPALAGTPTLQPDYIYSFTVNGETSGATPLLEQGSGCTQGICSGAFVGIGIPGGTRYQTAMAKEWDNFYSMDACFPTEYFNNQTLKELVLKFAFLPGAELAGQSLTISGISILESVLPPGYVMEVKVGSEDYNGFTGQYHINVAQTADAPSFFETYLGKYTAPTFPDAQHPSYIVGSITPNPSEQQTINLEVLEFQSFDIQPFTYLIGDLVNGSDTQRHHLNLVDSGGEFCLNFSVEFVFGGGDEFRYKAGTLNFNHPKACFQFRDRSALRVEEGASLHYGNAGAGMLALCAGSTLAIERGATLVVDAMLSLSECNDDLPPSQIYVDLPPGARLIFTENARISNEFSLYRNMLLNVRMLGGQLDDSALPPADRALIRRLIPEPAAVWSENVAVSPNPFFVQPTLRYSTDRDEPLHLRWTNAAGRLVLEQDLYAVRGMNEWPLEAPESAGFYFLEVAGERGRVLAKMVRAE